MKLGISVGVDRLTMSESCGVIFQVLLERLCCLQQKFGNTVEPWGPIVRCILEMRSKRLVV